MSMKYNPQQKNLFTGFAVAILCLCVLVSFSIRSVRESLKDEQAIGHSHQVKAAMFQFLSDISDELASARGYLLTGSPQDRLNTNSDDNKIGNDLIKMRSLVVGSAKQIQLLQDLETNATIFREHIQKGRDLYDKSGLQPVVEKMKAGTGRQRIATFKEILSSIDSEEDRILSEHLEKRKSESLKAELLILLGGILLISLLALSLTIMISDMKQIQDHSEQIAEKSKAAALGGMAGGIAHEINNPLAVIRAHAQLLRTLCKDREFRPELLIKSAGKIDETVQRIAKIVSGMLLLARNVKNDDQQAVALAELIDSSLEMCRNRFHGKGIELKVINPTDSLAIQCRPVELSQVLINLLNNAFDAVADCPRPWVELRVEEVEGNVKISVSDSGKGIPSVNRSRIMEPFFSTKEAGRGTGLGLSVSKAIVESHGGNLVLNNDIKHTCFEIHLPNGRVLNQITV